uniref:Uncharacterized protein n=1 Tax=Marinobacter nauticus TaxID=2743 RepID=A0A455WA99_MARNT|nr:hypothetical protein YBY_02360 [Marinobacter nauticus]
MIAVYERPLGLHHADIRPLEMPYCFPEKVGGRNEVCIKDGNVFSLGLFQPLGERTGFIALPVCPSHYVYIHALVLPELASFIDDGASLISGVIKNLNFKSVSRPVKLRCRVQQTVDHELLVIHR